MGSHNRVNNNNQKHDNQRGGYGAVGAPVAGNGVPSTIPRPLGLEGPAEAKFFDDWTNAMATGQLPALGQNDEIVFYVDDTAKASLPDFVTQFQAARPNVKLITADRVFGANPFEQFKATYRASPAPRRFMEAALQTEKLAELARSRGKNAHVLYGASTQPVLPPATIWSAFAANVLTAQGTKVGNLYRWDVDTFATLLKGGQKQQPIFQVGQPPLSNAPVDFSVDPGNESDGTVTILPFPQPTGTVGPPKLGPGPVVPDTTLPVPSPDAAAAGTGAAGAAAGADAGADAGAADAGAAAGAAAQPSPSPVAQAGASAGTQPAPAAAPVAVNGVQAPNVAATSADSTEQ
jgi:hypothetical protein